MKVTPTQIPDVKLIEPRVFGDERGFFMETWNAKSFADAGIDASFVQDNHSQSIKHTLRGLHYQIKQSQGKLVRVTQGEIFDVAVDLRRHSPTLGEWTGAILSAESKTILWVPPGFAHGFYVLSATAELQYKCTELYAPEHERAIAWDDPTLNIEWPGVDRGAVILSPKDREAGPFSQAELY